MFELQLVETADLLNELCDRYEAIVIVGAHKDDPGDITQVVLGPTFMCSGLLSQVMCEITATMTKPLEEDDER